MSFLLREECADHSLEGVLVVSEDVFSEPLLYPFEHIGKVFVRPCPVVVPRGDDDVVFGKPGVKADAHMLVIVLQVRQGVVDESLGQPEELDGLYDHGLFAGGILLLEKRDDHLGNHLFHFHGDAGENDNRLSDPLQAEPPGGADGVAQRDGLLGKHGLLGVVIGPAEPALGESILDRLQDGFIREEPQAVDLRDGLRGDVIGRGPEPPRDDDAVGDRQDAVQGVPDGADAVADAHDGRDLPAANVEFPGQVGRVGVLDAPAGDLVAYGEYAYFHSGTGLSRLPIR